MIANMIEGQKKVAEKPKPSDAERHDSAEK